MIHTHNEICKECKNNTLLRYPKGYFCWTCKRDIPDLESALTTSGGKEIWVDYNVTREI